jgi:phosphoglycolate phosphatase-like HAD superfamily hydrolase
MAMRLAFDMDGVLADLHTAYTQAALKLYPELDRAAIATADVGASPPESDDASADPDVPDPAASFAVSRRQSEAIWKHLGGVENFWQTLAEIEPGVIARLASLAEERRWEILFITSRPSSIGLTVQRQSQRWLQAKGFPLPSLFVVHGSRGRIAQALNLDVVVDDRPDNCLDVALESSAGAILLWRGSAASVPASAKRLGIAVSPTVHACLDMLIEAEEQSETDGSFLDRLRRVFGLRTRPASTILRRGAQ